MGLPRIAPQKQIDHLLCQQTAKRAPQFRGMMDFMLMHGKSLRFGYQRPPFVIRNTGDDLNAVQQYISF